MSEFLINNVLLTTFILSCLNILKHVWGLVNKLREEVPSRYQISSGERFLLGLSIAYIITMTLNGLQIQ